LTFALLVSAIMSAPWSTTVPLSVALGMCGLGGLAYGAIVIRRARRQTDYEPVWEDWLWHTVLPGVSYATLTVSAVLLYANSRLEPIVIGAAALGLLLIGIHNAWDTVIHIVVTSPDGDTTKTD
jgi:hypothetical protein